MLKKAILLSTASIILNGCNDNEVNLKPFTEQKVCIAAVATIMGKSPSIIKADNVDGNIIHVSYNRPSDGKHWVYRCKLNNDNVIWASETGRWRTDKYDSKILFNVSDDKLVISETYSDGSETNKTFTLQEFGESVLTKTSS